MPSDPSTTSKVATTLDHLAANNDSLNAFITVDANGALAAAAAADERHRTGQELGPLDGRIVAVKDCIDTADLRTTLGSALYAERTPAVDAKCVTRLREAGAVIIGKTSLTELACGTIGYNARFGDVANPRDRDRYPGGSSSGSAAALAAGLVDFAVGTDTSCSVRVPASFCGVVGLKPTFDRISYAGSAVLARTLDHVGPMATSVGDVAVLLGAMQANHWPDPTQAMEQRLHPDTSIGVLAGPFVETCSVQRSLRLTPSCSMRSLFWRAHLAM